MIGKQEKEEKKTLDTEPALDEDVEDFTPDWSAVENDDDATDPVEKADDASDHEKKEAEEEEEQKQRQRIELLTAQQSRIRRRLEAQMLKKARVERQLMIETHEWLCRIRKLEAKKAKRQRYKENLRMRLIAD